MGKAIVKEEMKLNLDNENIVLTPVSMGNPHGVIVVSDIEKAPLYTWGEKIEHHRAFTDGVNVEFVQILDPDKLRMRVWERGSGVTMACGTGACATVVACIKNGFLPLPDKSIKADIIYLCSPNNPTGAVYYKEKLQKWVDYANENGSIILFDGALTRHLSRTKIYRTVFLK